MSFAFKRMTRALLVQPYRTPTTANAFKVPSGFIKSSYNTFAIYNPNVCVIGLRGTSRPSGQAIPTTPLLVYDGGVDWEFPPGFWGVFSTQYPFFMSAAPLAVPVAPDVPADADLLPLRLWYGIGL
ncbi:hypothetical protein [Sphingomonas sp. Leaf10]|uniref:hypothetical protein n=1 Tax=Sphingomonas sp. Leaf10 TaxID=1735676 RepID=UPI0006F9054B|nr:hypothetical protein [Sphingomonas sp. Leaf10]KQM37945.1 hypothetical protein ASE59_11640 [Sphingomonas sp. Leaf10]